MKKIFLFMVCGFSALASVLENTGSVTKTIEVSDQKIPVYSSVNAKVPGYASKVPLFLTGAGIRTKKVLVVNAKVYVAESYASSKVGPAQDAQATLKNSAVKLLRLTFVRDVDAKKIKSSFSDALEANGLELPNLINKFDYDLKTKDVMVFLGYKPNNSADASKQTLFVEGPNGSFSVDGTSIADNFWKIWFGKPSDSGLEKLQPELMGVPSSEK